MNPEYPEQKDGYTIVTYDQWNSWEETDKGFGVRKAPDGQLYAWLVAGEIITVKRFDLLV